MSKDLFYLDRSEELNTHHSHSKAIRDDFNRLLYMLSKQGNKADTVALNAKDQESKKRLKKSKRNV